MLAADGGGGGAPNIEAIGEAVGAFAGAAAAGAFAVNETGGQALLKAIDKMKHWVDQSQQDLQNLAEEPPLGQSQGANTMRPYVASVASDGQGFLTMLLKFRESLDTAEQGINDAIKNYHTMDQGGKSRLSQ